MSAPMLCAVVAQGLPATGLHETPWLSGDDLPVQIGVYKRLALGLVYFSYFDGAHWLRNCRTADVAVRQPSNDRSTPQTLPWCGLVNPAPGGYGPVPCRTGVVR